MGAMKRRTEAKVPARCRSSKGESKLDEEVENEQEQAEEKKESAPGEAAAGKPGDGMNESGRNDSQTGSPSAFVKGPSGNVPGEVAAKSGEFVVHPKGKLGTMTPEVEGSENKNGVAETS
jgi:hypothetical protein